MTVLEFDAALRMLQAAVGSESATFHADQWESIDQLINDRSRLLVVQRTGWGKSMVYFIATRALRDAGHGPTIIVSPLLALMRNQIAATTGLGLNSVTINSTNPDDHLKIVESLNTDEVDVLLISPERLSNQDFINNVFAKIADRVGLLVIDEAHCISDWGHDFRPDYRLLRDIIRQLPQNIPVVGTTATANRRVCEDINEQLAGFTTIRGPLARESLRLSAMRLVDKSERLAWLTTYLGNQDGSGIVYVLTKRDAQVVSEWLNQQGIKALPYYSGVDDAGRGSPPREDLEQMLLGNQLRALVATTALGMGFDKPDLAFVVHFQAAGSIVGYYQQVGRAGRGIAHADGVLLSGTEDPEIHDFFRGSAFPDEDHVQQILAALRQVDGATPRAIEERVNVKLSKIQNALKFLSVEEPPPVVKEGSKWSLTPHWESWSLPTDRIAWLTAQREREWQDVEEYIDLTSCRMQFLQEQLDDSTSQPCGRCDNCEGDTELPSLDGDLIRAAALYLKRSEMPLEPRKQIPRDTLPIYDLGGRLSEPACTGRILSVWNDSAWGQMVAADKKTGRIREDLVDAMVEMISKRWRPSPSPQWVTCVPSQSSEGLVRDLAGRVAAKMGLPFVETISIARKRPPQKTQENSVHQCRNLDGKFLIDEESVQSGPVLLIDDIVDSRWTLTICAALLRKYNSGPVLPAVLATTNPGSV